MSDRFHYLHSREETIQQIPSMSREELKTTVRNLRDWYIEKIQNPSQRGAYLDEAKRFVQIVEGLPCDRERVCQETIASLESLKQAIEGRNQVRQDSQTAREALRPTSILSSLHRPYTVGAKQATRDWIDKDSNFSSLKSSIINLLNDQERLIQVYNQISNHIPRLAKNDTPIKIVQGINNVIHILRRAGIHIPAGGFGEGNYANIIAGAIFDVVNSRPIQVSSLHVELLDITLQQQPTQQSEGTPTTLPPVENKGDPLFQNPSPESYRTHPREVLQALGLQEADVNKVDFVKFLRSWQGYQDAREDTLLDRSLNTGSNPSIHEKDIWRRAGYNETKIYDIELSQLNALLRKIQTDPQFASNILRFSAFVPRSARQLRIIPNYKHTVGEVTEKLQRLSDINKTNLAHLEQDQEHSRLKKLSHDLIQSMKDYKHAKETYGDKQANLYSYLAETLRNVGGFQDPISYTYELSVYIIDKANGGKRFPRKFEVTGEQNTTVRKEGYFFGLFGSNLLNRTDLFRKMKAEDKGRIRSFVYSNTVQREEILRNIETHIQEGKNFNTIDKFTKIPTELKTYFRDTLQWNNADRDEINTLYSYLADSIINQQNFPSSMYERMKLLMDDNGNGVLEYGYSMEQGNVDQLFRSVVNDNSGQNIRNLFKNLGLSTPDEFFSAMSQNFYGQRKLFAEKLRPALVYHSGSSITTLIQDNAQRGWLAEQRADTVKALQTKAMKESIATHLTRHGNIPSGHPNLGEWVDETYDIFSASYINDKLAIGAGISLEEYTAGWLKNINITFDGGTPRFSLATHKRFNTGTTVGLGFGSGGIDVAFDQGLGGTTYTPKVFFETVRDIGMSFSGSASFSQYGTYLGINMNLKSPDTAAGINEQLDVMQAMMLSLKDAILKKKPASQVEYNGAVLSDDNQKVYKELLKQFELVSQGASNKSAVCDQFIASIIEVYRGQQFRNAAEGWKFSGLSIGIFYNVMLLLSLRFERIDVTTRIVDVNQGDQERVTKKPLALDRIGGGIETIDGQTVLSIPQIIRGREGQKLALQPSVSYNSSVQIKPGQKNGVDIWYIGGVAPSDIEFREQAGGSGIQGFLVIGGGQQEGQRYVHTRNRGETPTITQSIQGIETGTASFKHILKGVNLEINSKLHNIVNLLTSRLSAESITTSKTKGMMALQGMIYEMKKGNKTVQETWDQYMAVIQDTNNNKQLNQKYLFPGEGSKSYDAFLQDNLSIKRQDEAEKIYILQVIALAFTSRDGIERKESDSDRKEIIYTIKEGKTINEYNAEKKRDVYFDRIMQSELGTELAGNIATARKAWNAEFGKFGSYQVFPYAGEALSANEVRVADQTGASQNVQNHYRRMSGLAAISGAFELIGTPKDGLKPIKVNATQRRILLDKQPDYIKVSYRDKLCELLKNQNLTLPQALDMIANGSNGVKMNVFFGKNAQCINDAIILDIKMHGTETHTKPVTLRGASSAATQIDNVEVNYFSLTAGWETKDQREQHTGGGGDKDDMRSDPGNDNERLKPRTPSESSSNSGHTNATSSGGRQTGGR